jgi:S-(hydroxymethyl)glutathione dehydrogenase/alcohol dehydrogenase
MSYEARAAVWRGDTDKIVVDTISVEPPQRDEITIRLAACGVCHSDLSATNGTLALPPPLVLGHEGAGVVVEIGDGVTEFAVGDHAVTSFVSMCGQCRYCAMGRPSLCDQVMTTFATLPDGTVRTHDAAGLLNVFCGCGVMAEYATLSVDNAIRVDSSIPLASAALLGCAVTTGVGAVTYTARLAPGSTAVVFGAGGGGLNVIQGCRIAGAARIVAIDRVAVKLEMAMRFGATDTVNAAEEGNIVKAVRRLTDGGADYSFECVGRGEIAAQAFGVLRRGGTAVVIGVAPADDKTSIRTLNLTLEEKTLTGSYFGSARPREDFPRLLALYASGELMLDELITQSYAIEEAPTAFADLAAGQNARGMIVF